MKASDIYHYRNTSETLSVEFDNPTEDSQQAFF